jgi:GH35 family endo-1,4-beta-xylanase
MSPPGTSKAIGVIVDAAVAADIICTLIEKFRKLGVKVTVSELDAQLAARKAKRQKAMEDAGLI